MAIHAATFLGAEPLAEGTRGFRFAKPEGFGFRAGQAVNVTLLEPPETDGKGNSRTFSLVSAPHEDTLAIATRMRDTAFKRVLGALAPGTTVKVRGPMGTFTLPDDPARPVVFLAGGIGITPFVSMLRHEARAASPRPRVLVYSNRRPEDAPFLEELQGLAAANGPFRLVATMTGMDRSAREWAGERGMVDAALLARHLPTGPAPVHYIAGPPAMVAALRTILTAAGVAEGDIRTDEFFGY
jgi:ferredoxin-NADP reductase